MVDGLRHVRNIGGVSVASRCARFTNVCAVANEILTGRADARAVDLVRCEYPNVVGGNERTAVLAGRHIRHYRLMIHNTAAKQRRKKPLVGRALPSASGRPPVTDATARRSFGMECTTLRTLKLVIGSIPAYDFGLVAAIGQELVKHVVVRAGCTTRHACHSMPWKYIYLVAVLTALSKYPHLISLSRIADQYLRKLEHAERTDGERFPTVALTTARFSGRARRPRRS